MSIEDTSGAPGTKSPQLPLQIPSGHVHVYFVQPSMTDKKGVERSVVYYTAPNGTKFKFMARNPAIREDIIALGKRSDLADVDEEFTWAKGGALTIRVMPRA
jgi:hypothetical protein